MSEKPTKNRSKDLMEMRLLKDEEIKRLFRISNSCLYRWRKEGKIPFRKVGGTNYYIEAVIVKMLYLRGGKIPNDFDDVK